MTTSSTTRFGRVLTAMATPFTRSGELDLVAIARTATYLVDNGNDGLIVSGTTGESATTTTEEDGHILAAVKEAVGDRATVIAGIGTNDTRHTIELTQQAAKLGADGLLLVTPYYNKPTQAGIVNHVQQVVHATALPVMLYDVPGRTGTTIAPSTYEIFAANGQVVAVKDAAGDPTRAAFLRRLGYDVYSGDDGLTLGFLAYGACGVVSVLGHVAGNHIRLMIDAFLSGDLATAHKLDAELRPALEAVMGVPNYGATTAKAALEALGILDNRVVRSPLMALDEAEYAAVCKGLAETGLLGQETIGGEAPS